MLRALLTFAIVLLFGVSASAREQPQVILVLDASRSMWGQIDSVAKITSAQEVIGELLQTLTKDQLLGLTVYGARRKGDCSDIEILVAPTIDRETIAQQVNRITLHGKTPMNWRRLCRKLPNPSRSGSPFAPSRAKAGRKLPTA